MNRRCEYCGGWELGDGTEDADWNACECDEELAAECDQPIFVTNETGFRVMGADVFNRRGPCAIVLDQPSVVAGLERVSQAPHLNGFNKLDYAADNRATIREFVFNEHSNFDFHLSLLQLVTFKEYRIAPRNTRTIYKPILFIATNLREIVRKLSQLSPSSAKAPPPDSEAAP